MASLAKRGLSLATSSQRMIFGAAAAGKNAVVVRTALTTATASFPPPPAARTTNYYQAVRLISTTRRLRVEPPVAVCPGAVDPAPPTPIKPDIKEPSIANYDDVFRAIQRRRTTILDVRTLFEAKTFGRIPNSVLIPHDKLEYAMNLAGSDFRLEYGFYKPDTFAEKLIAYCRSGARATLAAILLRDKFGFRNVNVYKGSWIEWEKLHPEHVKKLMPPTSEEIFAMMTAAAVLRK